MNIIVVRDKLKEALDVISRASGEHPTLPILKNVLIKAGDDGITLTTTNLEIGLEYKLSGKTKKGGNLTAPTGPLSQIISSLKDERIELKENEGSLVVSTENYKGSLQGAPPEEFPDLPKIDNEEEYIEIDSSVLRSSVEAVMAAAQPSELRPELSSIFFQFLGNSIVFVATDSFRLAEKTINDDQFSATIQGEFKVLLPLRTAQDLVRILGDVGKVKIYRDPNQVLFTTDKLRFISRLLEGSFPDYKAIIPKGYGVEVSLDRDELLGAVKLASVMSGESSEAVLRPAPGSEGTLEIFSRDEKVGENACRVAAKMSGKFKEVAFNWRYLTDGVKTMPPKDIILGINDDNKPAIIKSKQDPSYFYILMPILKS